MKVETEQGMIELMGYQQIVHAQVIGTASLDQSKSTLVLVLVSTGDGLGGESTVDWGQIVRLWLVGVIIFDWTKLISLFILFFNYFNPTMLSIH